MYGINKLKIRIVTAVVMVAAVLFVMLCSVFYIVEHTDHDCTGEDCPICAYIQQCDVMLRCLETGLAIVTGFFAYIYSVKAFILLIDHFFVRKNPVSGKVRLNN